MKTKAELKALKNKAEALNKKLTDVTRDEWEQVTGGAHIAPHDHDPEPFIPGPEHIGPFAGKAVNA